jgi:hypothetical protein
VTDSLKFCAHYSRPEIELLRAPTRAALISIRDPGSRRPAYEIEQWPDLLELQFHDITSEELRDEAWWESWAKEGYLVPCRENAVSIANSCGSTGRSDPSIAKWAEPKRRGLRGARRARLGVSINEV